MDATFPGLLQLKHEGKMLIKKRRILVQSFLSKDIHDPVLCVYQFIGLDGYKCREEYKIFTPKEDNEVEVDIQVENFVRNDIDIYPCFYCSFFSMLFCYTFATRHFN